MQKYKFVICDDAAFIRTRLVKLITSHFPEAEVTGVYSNGEDALIHLKREPVDILITDIRMENIDGLTVIQSVYEQRLHTKTIIITGYQDFEYAQKALKYHVHALITKPIDPTELRSAISESMATLAATYTAAANESRNILHRHRQTGQMLYLFFSGKINAGDLHANTAFPGDCPYKKEGFVLFFSLPANTPPVNTAAWDDSVLCQNDAFEIYVLNTSSRSAAYIVFLLQGAAQTQRQKLQVILEDTIKSISLFYHTECIGSILPLKDVAALLNTNAFLHYGEFLNALANADAPAWHPHINALISAPSLDVRRIMLSHFLVYLSAQQPELDLSAYHNRLSSLQEPDATALLLDLQGALTAAKRVNDDFSNAMLQYIHNNIANKALSLEIVANHFNYSPEHFSRKFKKALNVTFQTYLSNLRLEQAKKLLGDRSLSIVAISNMVGFKNPAYFSKVFKKHTGRLPKDYRYK